MAAALTSGIEGKRWGAIVVDEDLLTAHRSFTDEANGLRERFVRLDAGPGSTWGVLSTPLGEARSLGWVVCHPFGSEQVDLHMPDVAMARRLAMAGFPVLRFACQGYGDSDDVSTPAGPASHLRDTLDAVRQMPALAEVERVGTVGSRFGGTVAALVADREDLPYVVMAAPIVSGPKYTTELFRSRVIVDIIHGWTGPSVEDLKATLDAEGMVNVKGLPLHRAVFDEFQELDLTRDLRRFSGRALLFQVSRGETPQGQLMKLRRTLEGLGAKVDLEVVTDPAAPHFGYEHFQPVAKDELGDSLETVNETLAASTARWAEERWAGR